MNYKFNAVIPAPTIKLSTQRFNSISFAVLSQAIIELTNANMDVTLRNLKYC